MARLAVSLAGAAAGFAIGGPTGARLGFTAGSILGNVLFPADSGGGREGPRLGDLQVSASTYGQPIPKAYGTVRLAGNCFWATPLKEVRNVSRESSGGKGGTSQSSTSTTYSYFADFALAFAEGQADDVIRIWADGKLIYDKSGTGSLVRKSGLKFRFYGGSETQLPDSIMEADKGVGNVPAHRGLVYIVFDDLPLADFGNRRPQITAEIAMSATPAYPFERFSVPDYITSYGVNKNLGTANGVRSMYGAAYDDVRKYLYLPLIGDGTQYIARVKVPSMVVDIIRSSDDIWEDIGESRTSDTAGNRLVPVIVDPNTNSLICTTASDNHKALLRLDGNSLQATESIGVGEFSSSPVANSTGVSKLQSAGLINFGSNADSMVFVLSVEGLPPVFNGTVLAVFKPRTLEMVYFDIGIGSTNYGRQVITCGTTAFQSRVLFLSERADTFSVWEVDINAGAYYDELSGRTHGVEGGLLKEITPAVMNEAPGIKHVITGLQINDGYRAGPFGYDPDTNAIIGVRQWLRSGGDVVYAMSIDVNTGGLNWVTFLTTTGGIIGEYGTLGDLSKTQTVRVGVDRFNWYELNKQTGEVIDTFNPTTWLGSNLGITNAVIDYDFDAMIRTDIRVNEGPDPETHGGLLYFNRGTGEGAALSDIVSDLSASAGLESSEINITELISTEVKGYTVGRVTSVRGALEPLAAAYFFDAVESDYVLKYLKRGRSSSAVIEQDDLGETSGNSFLIQDRGNEQEIPMRVTVAYSDLDRDYQEGTQAAKRAAKPFPVMYSRDEAVVGLPIVLVNNEAKQIAEKILFNTWQERDRFETSLSWEYLKLDPADTIDINLDDGTSYKLRLTGINLGANLAMSVSALSEETANYTSSGVLAENNFTPSEIKGAAAASFLRVHNVPLLADTHEQARLRSVLYAQAGPFVSGAGWTGATLYSSSDQVTWSPVTRIVNELTYGAVQGTLAAPLDVFAVDTINTLKVWPTTGASSLESISYAQLLAGELNIAIVGGEVINFQNVTDNGDGSYTLDTFLRGRRGTDTVADKHTSGEYFYLINEDNAEGFTIPLNKIGAPMYFKAVGDGQALEEAFVVTLTPTGEDLKPYAPVNPVRTDNDPASGDITVSWSRRTRINGSGSGTVPLNEDTEEYEVDILDGAGGAVLRAFSSLSSTSFTYTSSQQVTDSFAGGTLYCRIYQISAQVGRGKSYEFALEVT